MFVCVCVSKFYSSFVSIEQLILLLIHKIVWSKYREKMCIYEAAKKHPQFDWYCS